MTTSKQRHVLSDLRAAAERAQNAYLWDEAVDHFSRALILPDLSPAEEYRLLDNRAFCYQRLGKYYAEVDDLVAMAKLAQDQGDNKLFLDSLTRQAFALTYLGEIDKSRVLALEVKDKAIELGDRLSEANALQVLGKSFIDTGEFERASHDLAKAIEIFQKLGALREEAMCAYHLAYAGSFIGRKSEKYALRVKEIAEQLDDRLLLGMAHLVLGIIHQDQPSLSLIHQEQALDICQSIGEIRMVGSLTNNLGVFYLEFGLFYRSVHLLNQAVEIFLETQSRTNYLLSLHMASLVDYYLGNLEYAAERNQQAIMESHEAGIQSVEAFARTTQGLIQWNRGELEEALETLLEAADLVEGLPAYIPFVLGLLAGLYLDLGNTAAADRTSEKALEIASELHNPVYIEVPIWSRYSVLSQLTSSTSETEEAWNVLLQGRKTLSDRCAAITDRGLRRAFLSRSTFNQNIILEWVRQAHHRGEPLTPLLDVQSGEGNIQQQFKRLLDTGTRLASQSDPSSMLSFIMEEFVDLSGAERVLLSLRNEDAESFSKIERSYGIDVEEQGQVFEMASTLIDQAVLSRQAVIAQGVGDVEEGDPPEIHLRSVIVVPLVSHARVLGMLYADVREIFGAFNRQDADLLTLLANQSASALENAQLIEGLERTVSERTADLQVANSSLEERLAELALINSVQEGLASKLDIKAIFELVGKRISEIFAGNGVSLYTYDAETDMSEAMYILENGVRHYPPPFKPGPIGRQLVENKKPLMLSTAAEFEEMGAITVEGTEESLSGIYAPLVVNDRSIGAMNIECHTKEYSFTQSDLRLLTTLANSTSVALENARLFDETQRLLKETEDRNAELAIINTLQRALAAELDIRKIYQAVGEKLREIFDSQVVALYSANLVERTLTIEYGHEKEQIFEPVSVPFNSLNEYILELQDTFVRNGDYAEFASQFEDYQVSAGQMPKSVISVPVRRTKDADTVVFLSLQDVDGEKEFTDADIRLLETLANSMAIALENARLLEETQRLLKETEERNAELAIINDVQAGLVARVEMGEIYDLVGDRVQKIFDSEVVVISRFDVENNLHYYEYTVEKGERFSVEPQPINPIIENFIKHKSVYLANEGVAEQMEAAGAPLVAGEAPLSVLAVPLLSNEQMFGAISLQNVSREHAFSPSDVQLLETLAASLSVALENARLFEETQRLLRETEQRAQELAIINTVSQALVAETEFDALIQLIGDQIREIFLADIVFVALLDQESKMINFPYTYGEDIDPLQLGEGLTSKIIESGEPLLINRELEQRRTEIGATRVGKEARSFLGIPIQVGTQSLGVISVQSTEEEGLFNESDLNLLNTIAANVSTALRNAGLFDEIKRQKQYYQAVIENSPAAIVLISPDLQITGWNPAAEKLFGYTEEEALGRNIDDLVAKHEEIYMEAVGYSQRGVREKQIHLITQRTRKDGSLVDVEVSGLPVIVDGEQVAFIAIYHDITELQRARQEAEEANQAKSTFLANMSHELRTPLNAIIGFTRIVRRKGKESLPEKQVDNLDKVLVSADHLLGLINTILDIAKIEAGRMEVQSAKFEFQPLADLVVATTQPLVKDSVELVCEIPSALPQLHTDQEKLKQILINLLSNAAKFTQEGQITLSAQVAEKVLLIQVRDTGIGISPEALERIFDEFQQADTSTTRQYGGTGLGLSISKSLAQLLGGDLTASSEEDVGSVFSLAIPLRYGEDFQPKPSQPVRDAEYHQATDQLVILSIDDDPHVHDLLRENLDEHGYQVVGALNGVDGLHLAHQMDPFAITLDIMMPHKDGWQVLYELKADPATRDIPVILVTIVDKQSLGYQLGAADYLVKPLEEDAVLYALQRIHSQQRSESPLQLLVVDDDPNISDMVRQLLAEAPYQIVDAPNGQVALEMIHHIPPDVILLDLMMPRMDGFTLIESLREEAIYIPIIVLTAKTLNTIELEALEDSVERVIQKSGLDQERLLAELRKSMEKVHERKASRA